MSGRRSALPPVPLSPLLLLLLLSALCWQPLLAQYPGSTSSCFSHELNITLEEGEQVILPSCGGLVGCPNRRYGLQYLRCPRTSSNACKRLEPSLAGSDAPFPRCCPRITCEECYSARHDRYFGGGESWTEGNCMRHTCDVLPSGMVDVVREACPWPGPPPPFDGCELVGQDLTRGEFPLCCAHYRCPGRCLDSKNKWVSQQPTKMANACTEP